MNLEQILEDLRARVALMQGAATLLILVAPTETATHENHRILADILRSTSLQVVDLGRIGRQFGPAAWAEHTLKQPGDVHLLAATPESVFEASTFATLVNAEREFLRQLAGPVLLVISRETEDILRKRAPDFLTWASTVYELPEPAQFLAMARLLGAMPTSSQRHIRQEKPLRFLHLSDFHLRPGLIQRYDQDKVLRGLIEFLRRDRPRFQLDAIFVTGDLAFSGSSAEYVLVGDFFKKLMEVTGVLPERTFVVPGNHDVDRSVGEWLLRTLPSPEMADKFFLQEKAREAHMRKFEAYHKGLAPILGEKRKLGLGVGKDAIEMIAWDDARIAVASFNSAWFALSDSDLGKLWLGDANVAEAGDRLAEENATFCIALMHHPLEHLDEQERDTIEDRFERTFDMVLRGHLHKNKTKVLTSQRGGYVEIAGQAAYQTSQWPNGCYLGEIRPCARTVKLFPYQYAKGADPWVMDTKVFPDDAADGYARTFVVPEKRIVSGTVRRVRERAAAEVVQTMSSHVKEQMAQELGWHDASKGNLSARVEQRIARKAAVANEDAALWARPEQAKKFEKAVVEAVAEEAMAKMPDVPKISRQDPDFLEKALVKVTPILMRKAATLQSPSFHALKNLLAALLGHAIDGPVHAMEPILVRGEHPPDIVIGALNDSEFEQAAIKFTTIPSMNADISNFVNEMDVYLEETHTHNAAIVLLIEPGSQLIEPLHEHRTSPNGYDILISFVPIKVPR